MILLRTTKISDRLERFAEELSLTSGKPVTMLVDERFSSRKSRFDIVPVAREKLEEMGVFCPQNFAWRYGDFGYYLARKTYPQAAYFWMIEHDVRFHGSDVKSFFERCAEDASDLLATWLAPATRDWHWTKYASSRDGKAWRSLPGFTLVRGSDRYACTETTGTFETMESPGDVAE